MTENANGANADNAGVAFHPPFLLLGAIAVGFVLRAVWRGAFLPESVTVIAGPIMVIASLAVFAWAVITMHRGGASVPTNTPTDAIIVSGPYALSRNPIYTSMVVLVLGIGVWANSLWFVGLALMMIVLLVWGVISREELYLERKFGERYVAYKARVRRWL